MNSPETDIDLDFLRTLTILYVEDEDEVREALARYLRRRCHTLHVAANGQEGLELFKANHYDVVVTDVKMPVMDGLDMARSIKAIHEKMPVIIVTAYNEVDYFMRAIEVGVDRYVKKPIDPEELVKAIYKSTIIRFQEREQERNRQTALDTVEDALIALGHAIEKRNPFTDGHETRVARLSVAIAKEMGLPRETIAGIRLGASIHDIGNLNVPAEILCAPRNLTPEEFEAVKTHPQAGHDILKDISFPWPINHILLQHHERLDGSGYPEGLKGEEILLEARIVGVADVVEAMSSNRPHRAALGIDAAIAEIQAKRDKLYDPQVVDSCVAVLMRHNKELDALVNSPAAS